MVLRKSAVALTAMLLVSSVAQSSAPASSWQLPSISLPSLPSFACLKTNTQDFACFTAKVALAGVVIKLAHTGVCNSWNWVRSKSNFAQKHFSEYRSVAQKEAALEATVETNSGRLTKLENGQNHLSYLDATTRLSRVERNLQNVQETASELQESTVILADFVHCSLQDKLAEAKAAREKAKADKGAKEALEKAAKESASL